MDAGTPKPSETVGSPRLAQLMRYFRVRPIEDIDAIPDFHDLWKCFVDRLGEANLAQLVAHLGHAGPQDIRPADYLQLTDRAKSFFADWLEEFNFTGDIVHADPHGAPAWMLMDLVGEPRPAQTPLFHFTDHVEAVMRDGFAFGVDDFDALALTRMNDAFGNVERREHAGPGFNFAYLPGTDLDVRADAYGAGGILLRAPCVEVWHAGDREAQAIFHGPDANRTGFIAVSRRDGFWTISTGRRAKSLNRLVRTLTDRDLARAPEGSQPGEATAIAAPGM